MLDRTPDTINQVPMRNEPGVSLAALIVLACLFGGGGVAYGLPNLVVQIAALVVLGMHGPAVWRFVRKAPRGLVILALLTLALPLLQLIPLPPAAWQAIPGRELLRDSLGTLGQLPWHPLTVSTARTLVAFLGLIAPFAVLMLVLQSDSRALHRAKQIFIAMGIAGVVLGTMQVLAGGESARLYVEAANQGVLAGLFANRNSTAIFFVCCLLLLCSSHAGRILSMKGLVAFGTAALLVVGVILTQSRTGLVLLALPGALFLLRLIVNQRGRQDDAQGFGRTGRGLVAASLAVVLVALGIGAGMGTLPQTRFDTVMDRFNKTTEERPAIWEDARFSAQRYWPVGAGMGTFDEVFQIDESLENITSRRAGRAHNDYLELAIEAGAAGFLLIALWAGWILWSTWTALGNERRWDALAHSGILLAIALQSLVDYPLRNQTMLCLAAFAVAILTRASAVRPSAAASDGRKS